MQLKCSTKIEIKVISLDDWQLRFSRIINKIQKKAAQFSAEEIETDIAEAI